MITAKAAFWMVALIVLMIIANSFSIHITTLRIERIEKALKLK